MTAAAYTHGRPGDVTLTSAPFSGFGLGPDQAVTVFAGRYTEVSIDFDSGVR